jgi:predicted ATP-binding protein involved in virulence
LWRYGGDGLVVLMAGECGMRITKISVEKLFGIFDHAIPLNLDDRITIIHGPNGYGKTVILKMLNGLFHSIYSDLRSIPYKSFHVEFDDGRHIEVQKELPSEKQDKIPGLTISLHLDGKRLDSFNSRHNQKELEHRVHSSELEDFVPGLVRISSRRWLYSFTGEELSDEEVLERFSERIPGFKRFERKEEAWFTEIKREVNVYFIESQRLLSFSSNRDMRSYRKNPNAALLPTVTAYSEELVQEVREKLTDYAAVAQSLDRSFPARVLRQKADELTNEDLRGKLDELEKHRNRLVESGLLEKDEGQSLPIQSHDIDESTKNVLSVYIEDVEKKLDVFGDIAEKIDLFRRIVNSKFSYKELVVSREKGFIFRSKYPEGFEAETSEFLSPSSLSSGEQHELVLLYELLFKVKRNSLVLIDEPELSLHIGWQVNFLKEFQEITQIADLDLLVATHSPDLIADRWDLTVELKGIS